MIVSKKLINKFLPKFNQINNEQFVEACNTIGIEVESIFNHPKTNNLVIGKIIKVVNHPNADRLHLCEVDVGEGKINHIICGANNVKENKKVIVALENAQLIDGRKIEYKDIRGTKSEGMLCAYSELTTWTQYIADEDKNGIILLDDAIIGDKDVCKYIGFDDTIYDLSLPSNRNDLNGVLSLCQEISAYFKWDFKYPSLKENKSTFTQDINISYNKNFCKGFTTTVIKDVNHNQSSWLNKSLLMNNGIKPINTTIDKLSYITLLTNIPAAVYDNKEITNIETTSAKDNELFNGLNDKQYTLKNGDIVVKSGNDILSVAGILGSKKHMMSKTTKDIIVEFANFNSPNIRNTSIAQNITTDAAKRFSKQLSNYLIKLSVNLLFEQFQGLPISNVSSKFEDDDVKPIDVDYSFIESILGERINKQMVQDNLTSLGFSFNDDKCFPPPNRLDVLSSQDIAEEIAKFLNINVIMEQSPHIELNNLQNNIWFDLHQNIKSLMNANMISEVITYNLTNLNNLQKFNIFKLTNHIDIQNVNNSNHATLRNNLIDRMLKVYQMNISFKNDLQPIFEIQNIYADVTYTNLTILSPNIINIDNLSKSNIKINLNVLRALADQIANIFNTSFTYLNTTQDNEYFYKTEMLAIHSQGQLVGYVGLLKSSQLREYDLSNHSVYCLSINFESLLKTYKHQEFKIKHINNLMPIFKDISFTINDKESIRYMIEAIDKLPFISNYQWIDTYKIDDNNTSYTIRFRFNNTKNLLTKDINQYMSEIEKQMIENHCSVRK